MGHQPATESKTPAEAVAGADRPTASAPTAHRRTTAGRRLRGRIIRDIPSTISRCNGPALLAVSQESPSNTRPHVAGRRGDDAAVAVGAGAHQATRRSAR